MSYYSSYDKSFDAMLYSYKYLMLCADKIDQEKDRIDDWISIDILLLGFNNILVKQVNRYNIDKFLMNINVEINQMLDAKAYGILAFKYYDKFMREYILKPDEEIRIFGKIFYLRLKSCFKFDMEIPSWFNA